MAKKHTNSKYARKATVDPLTALALATGAFFAGVVVERKTELSRKAEAGARSKARQGQEAVSREVAKQTAAVRKSIADKAQEFSNVMAPKTRNNGGAAYREEVLEAFFANSRISREALKQGLVDMTCYVYEDLNAYENGGDPEGPFELKDSAFWAQLRPGNVVECMISDPEDEDAETAESDCVAVEVTGTRESRRERAAREAAETRAAEDLEYGRAARSHKGNPPAKKAPAKKAPAKKAPAKKAPNQSKTKGKT